MTYAGILAAGAGVKMPRQDMPMQFLPLGEKPIIINTLEQFFINTNIDKIVVAAPESWKQFTEDLIGKYDKMGKEVVVIVGDESKTASVWTIVKYIEALWGINDNDILLTHDAVRPFVTQRMIDENIETAKRYDAAGTAMTTNDTILVSEDGITVSDIPPKRKMFAAQTPQTFKLKTLEATFKNALKQNITLSMESELARLYTREKKVIQFVHGEYSNMKIISSYDLEVANALLRERST
ncbi:MAG: D-ribitol-5-phosphate cytidylyltransferase [Fibromonadaceae bacterium]|jgi:2-C-methyl-D-erythritol 4-phosphate cytidylyltransferase|nr:D-ribitol-5-phosphate cytidylyltransferase [Fibromonadaceae bacterium]